MARSTRERHEKRLASLKQERSKYEAQWQELAEYVSPARLRLNGLDQKGSKLRKKIVDATGSYALRTLASGMHSGITSPARPWFRLTISDTEMREFAPVKQYLSVVQNRMREILGSSNVYNCFHTGYADLGLFGQSCGLLVEDRDNYIQMHQFTHGEFWIANDERGRVATLYRLIPMTVEQMVAKFKYQNVSLTIRTMYDKGNYDEWINVYSAIEPRHDRDPRKVDGRNKPFMANYWEEGDTKLDAMLSEGGYSMNPIIAPRWNVVSNDHYGQSPGQDALPDVKMLQTQQQRKGEGIDKIVRPPMKGPTSLKNNPKSLLPGQITYVDDPNGTGFTPVMQVNLRLGELTADIREVQDRVRQAFYADLFMMISNMEGIQPRNVMEIAERKEEKLLALGPVLERLYGEQLNPAIDIIYEQMNERGILPPPPKELQGQELKVDYISTLAQAQKAVATGSIERFVAFTGNLAGARPDVLDKVDFDQAVDEYGDMVGVPPAIVVSDDKVAQARQERAQRQEQARQAEMAAATAPAIKQTAEAARVLSEADANGGVGDLLSNLGIA